MAKDEENGSVPQENISPPEAVEEHPVEGDGISFLQTRLSVNRFAPSEDGQGGYVEVDLYIGPL